MLRTFSALAVFAAMLVAAAPAWGASTLAYTADNGILRVTAGDPDAFRVVSGHSLASASGRGNARGNIRRATPARRSGSS
jgi:hypothetical protein